MTTDTKLLPLPWSDVQPNGRRWLFKPEDRPRVEDYARACVAAAVEAKGAEIEALRVEVAAQRTRADAMAGEATKHEARAEWLAESLRLIEAAREG